MKQKLLLASFLFFGTTVTGLSDPMSDASYIVEQHITSSNVEEKLDALSADVVAQMNPVFKNLGAHIIDPNRFKDVLMGDFAAELVSEISETAAAAFHEQLMDEELAALADYYRSDEGQALLARGFSSVTSNDYIKLMHEGAGAPVLEHIPEMLETMEAVENKTIARLDDVFALGRMADLMEMEGLVAFDDEARRQTVVDALRKAE